MATPIRFQGLVKPTAEIESDKFAGRVGWSTTLARYIAYYNSTQYAQMARRDVLETFVAGLQDSTLGVGLPMFAGASGRLSTESVANFRSRIAAVNRAGDTMTGGLTLSAGNLNVGAGAIQTAGVTRISSGGAGTLTTLSTTGMVTAAQATVSDIPVDCIATTLTGGRLSGDAGAKVGRTGGVVRSVTFGDGLVDNDVGVLLNGKSGRGKLFYCRTGGSQRWVLGSDETPETGGHSGSNFILRAYADDAGLLDTLISIGRAPGSDINFGGSAVTKRDVNLTKDLKLSGVVAITAGRAGSLTTLVTTGLTTVQSLNISGLTGSRMLSLDASKNVQALDAAGSRALLGLDGSRVITPVVEATETPPASPAIGAVYWVAYTPTGAWTGQPLKYAMWSGTAWSFFSEATPGELKYDLTHYRVFTSSGIGVPRMLIVDDIFAQSADIGSFVRVGPSQVLCPRRTGWAAATGTATRTTFATSTVTLPQLAERLKALIDDLTTHGLIGA